MALDLKDRLLIWSYSETVAYTVESCDWYSGESLSSLCFSASQFIEDQLYALYGDFSEWFNLAEFPDVQGQLELEELPVFIKAAGRPGHVASTKMGDNDSFSGLRAVIRHRLAQQSLKQLTMAAELFNWTIDFGLEYSETRSQAVIKAGRAEDVAPCLLERILNRLHHDAMRRKLAPLTSPSRVEQRFLSLLPVLTMLKETVESEDWVQNQLALDIFFWIVETYHSILAEELND